MWRRNKQKYITTFLILLVCAISIGYALIAARLEIDGNTAVRSVKWNVHYDNVKVTTGSVLVGDASITSDTLVEYSATLNKPGDFYEFTVDVVNEGGLDAIIESIADNGLDASQKKFLSYSISYNDASKTEIKTGDKLLSGETKTILVRVEFMTDIEVSDLSSSDVTVNLSFGTKYIQDGTSGSSSDEDDEPTPVEPTDPEPEDPEEERGEDFISNSIITGYSWVSDPTPKTVTKKPVANRATTTEPLLLNAGDSFTVRQTSDYVFGYFFATKDEDGIYHYDKDYGWQTQLASGDVTITSQSDNTYIITNWKKSNNGNMNDTDGENIKALIVYGGLN